MKTTNVKNNHNARLDIAGVEARPGATVAVPLRDFESWKLGHAAKTWLEDGLVEEVSNAEAVKVEKKAAKANAETGGEGSGAQTGTDGRVDRAAYLAKAKELDLGLKANVSNADLVKAVNEAEAKKALDEAGSGSGDNGSGSGE